MEERHSKSSEEIDLLYFLRPVNNGIKRAGRAFSYYILLLKKNLLLFFSIIMLITLAGFLLRYVIKPGYQTNAIFNSRFVPAKYCAMLIATLNRFKDDGNLPVLGRELGIPVEAANTICSIKFLPLYDSLALKSRDTSLSLFNIQMVLSSMQYLDTIQKGLINYFETSPFILRRKEIKIRSLTAMKLSIIEKLKSLDSLKKIVNNSITPRSQGQGIILGEPINPISIYQAETDYFRDQLKIEEQLYNTDNIEILQPFIKLRYYNHPDYQKFLIYSFLGSVIIALFMLPFVGQKPKSN